MSKVVYREPIYDPKKKMYEMLSANNADKLNKAVKEKTDDGWKPWGSPFCNPRTLGHSLYQAVVKEVYVLEDE